MMLHMVAHPQMNATPCCTSRPTHNYSCVMQPKWKRWCAFAKQAKAALKASGGNATDIEIAEAVSELLEADGEAPVQRALVNAWLNGGRVPSLAEFLALCEVLGISQNQPLFGSEFFQHKSKQIGKVRQLPIMEREDPDIAKVVSLMKDTDAKGRAMALSAVMVALHGYVKPLANSQ